MTTMTHRLLTDYHPSPRPSVLARLAETVHLWHRRAHERRRLAELSEYELHDFGASSVDRFTEISKPFWRG